MKPLAGLLALFMLSGCSVYSYVINKERASENVGVEMRGDMETAVAVVEKVLQERGYMIATRQISKGPGKLAGRQVEGFRDMHDKSSAQAGTERPKLGPEVGELIRFEISRKWHVSYDVGVPDTLVVVASGLQCDQNSRGGLVNCRKSDDEFELASIMKDFDSQLRAVLAWEALPDSGGVPAGSGTEYQEARRLYESGNYGDAQKAAGELTRATPGFWEAWQLMGNCQYARGDRAGALISYKLALAINPGNKGLEDWVRKLEGK